MQNKTVLITGATSGIGYELSNLFAKDEYNLVLIARNLKNLESLAVELRLIFKVHVLVINKDLSIPSSSKEIVKELNEKSIKVDILVNNAGFNEYGLFTETNLQKELEIIQLNIASLTSLTKMLLPNMIKQKYGKILNVGSTGSFAPGPFNAVYCASKAYILSFSEAIAEDLKGTGVTITVLCPGATKTEFARRANMENVKIFKGNLMDAKEVAKVGYKALMRGKTTIVAGYLNKLAVFFLRFISRNFTLKISKGMLKKSIV